MLPDGRGRRTLLFHWFTSVFNPQTTYYIWKCYVLFCCCCAADYRTSACVAFLRHFIEKYATKFEAMTTEYSNPEMVTTSLVNHMNARAIESTGARDSKPVVTSATSNHVSPRGNSTAKVNTKTVSNAPATNTITNSKSTPVIQKLSKEIETKAVHSLNSSGEKSQQTKRPISAKNATKATSKIQWAKPF